MKIYKNTNGSIEINAIKHTNVKRKRKSIRYPTKKTRNG